MSYSEIEKIILQDDTRGMSNLYENIEKGFVQRSTDLILEKKGVVFHSVIERFFADPISSQPQKAVTAVPDSKGKHAVKLFDRNFYSPLNKSGKHHLRVRMTTKPMAFFLQFLAKFLEIIDLTIIGDYIPSIS